METLVLNGKSYVKASKAARDLGYTSDYVGQLCRGGHVDAHLVGRTWYVNPDTLTVHRTEKKRNARVKAREYAKKAIEESRSLSVTKTKNTYRNIPIRYEGDKTDLIPATRKVSVDGEKLMPVAQESDDDDSSPYVLENENKKVIMSGTLSIQDAEADPTLTDTTILTPTIRRSHRTHVLKDEPGAIDKERIVGDAEAKKSAPAQKSFVERIMEHQDTEVTPARAESQMSQVGKTNIDSVEEYDTGHLASKPASFALYIAGIIVVLVLSLLSVYLEQHIVWMNQSLVTNYSFDFEQDIYIGL